MKTLKPGQFTVVATFLSKPGRYEELKEVNRLSADLTKEAPGLLQMCFFEPHKEDKPFVFTAIWESESDFRAFMKSPKTQEFHNAEKIKELHEGAMEKATADFYTLMEEWHAE